MNREKRSRALRGLTAVAAVVVVATTVLLLADVAADRLRAPGDAQVLEELETRAKSDAAAAAELETERERQTERSLRRETRNRSIGWVLLVSSVVFLTGAKRLLVERARTAPAAGRLVQLRPLEAGAERRSAGGRREKRVASAERGPPDGAEDLTFVDEVVARHGRSREAAIPILQAIQNHYRYLPDEALRRLAELSEITPAQIAGTASFYAQFRRTPVGEHMVRICHGTACHVAGVEHVTDELRRQLMIPDGADTDPERLFTLDLVACLGCCSLAPVMMIGDETAGHLTPASAWEALRGVTA